MDVPWWDITDPRNALILGLSVIGLTCALLTIGLFSGSIDGKIDTIRATASASIGVVAILIALKVIKR